MKSNLVALVSIITVSQSVLGKDLDYSTAHQPPDVLLGLRQQGGSSEIVAVLGPISKFMGGTPGSSFIVPQVSPAEISRVFGSLNKLEFGVFATQVALQNTNSPSKTLWLTRPRLDPEVPSRPWSQGPSAFQGNVSTTIRTIGTLALSYSKSQPDGPDNDGNLVVIPKDVVQSYTLNIGENGDFKGYFYGDIHGFTPADFVDSDIVARADFYDLRVGSGPGSYLGYFEFRTDATLRFVTAGGGTPPAPAPSNLALVRTGTVNTISFSTISGPYTYRLLRAPASGPGANLSDWTVQGQPTTGTGGTVSIDDITTDDAAFYRVQVTP